MRRSSLTIGYPDLLQFMEKQVAYQQKRYDAARGSGGNLNAISHDKECAETLERMLKKCRPKVQADLFELYQKVTK